MRRMTGILAAGLAFVGLTCGVALAADAPLKIIYVSHADSGNPFWLTVKKGMDDACAQIKADCQMLYDAKLGDIQSQVANMQSAMAQSPDLIITSIPDDHALNAVIKEAVDSGIPVIASNVDHTQGAKGNARLAFVGQDFELAGRALGNAVAAKFPASGPIHVLLGVNAPAENWSRTRADGVKHALADWAKDHPDRSIKVDEIDAGLDYGTAGDRFGSFFTGAPDLNAYVDTGFWDVGVASALKDRGVAPGKIIIGGFDLVPDVLAQMKAGYIQFHVDQQPYLQGYVPAMQAPLIKKYKMAAFDVNTGSAVVGKDQVDAIEQLSKNGYR